VEQPVRQIGRQAAEILLSRLSESGDSDVLSRTAKQAIILSARVNPGASVLRVSG